MNNAHVHEMQVQMWKPNTWGVTMWTFSYHPFNILKQVTPSGPPSYLRLSKINLVYPVQTFLASGAFASCWWRVCLDDGWCIEGPKLLDHPRGLDYMDWKHRNRYVLQGLAPSLTGVLQLAADELHSWVLAGPRWLSLLTALPPMSSRLRSW